MATPQPDRKSDYDDIYLSLKALKEKLPTVENEQERIKIRETIKEINILLMDKHRNSELIAPDDRTMSRGKSDKLSWQKMQRKKAKMESNLQKLFLFYIEQFPSANGHFEKRTIENCDMTLNMFMVFVKQFNILGHERREPKSKNDLELKRRGIVTKINDHFTPLQAKKSLDVETITNQLSNFSAYREKIKQDYVAKYGSVPSKHKWWNEEDEFYRYYNPTTANGKAQNYKILDTMTLMQIFKKNTFMGKTADFEQFKKLLGVIAEHVYPDQSSQQSDLPLRFSIEVLSLHKTKRMKAHFKNLHHAFNITDQVGFRYDIPKEKPIGDSQIRSVKALPHSNKLLSKYMKRVSEMESLEKQKIDTINKFHENLQQSRISDQVRNMKRSE